MVHTIHGGYGGYAPMLGSSSFGLVHISSGFLIDCEYDPNRNDLIWFSYGLNPRISGKADLPLCWEVGM